MRRQAIRVAVARALAKRAIFAGIGILTMAAPGWAQVVGGEPALARGQWSFRLGAGVGVGPEYPGSREFSVTPVPLIDIAYRVQRPFLDTIFFNARDGLGVIALQGRLFSVGGSIGFARGRDEDDGARLNGLGDIDPAGTAGMFARLNLGPVGLSARVERAFGGQSGTTVTVGGSYRVRLAQGWMAMGQVGTIWADRNHMDQWFGIDALQSLRSGLAVYRPGSGFRSVNAGVTITYAINDRWSANVAVAVTQLVGGAADSPIVERATQPSGLIGVSYRF